MSSVRHLPSGFRAAPDCLKGKILLVTGAGDGIGQVASLAFAQHGATVILLGKSQSKLEETYDLIEASGAPQPVICCFDLHSEDPAAYKQIGKGLQETFGRLDGLLHNAALLGSRNSIESYKPSLWQEVMQINVNAAFLLTQAMLPLLRASPNASLLFTSSGVGRQGRAHWGAYSVSKFAIEGLMQVLADELEGTTAIRVNSINPGATRTRMRAQAYPAEDPQTVKAPESLMPLYLYLMSDASTGVSGECF